MPKSIAKAPSKKTTAKVVGDITTLDLATTAGLRSDGFVRMQKQIDESVLDSVMAILKSALSLPANASPTFGTTLSLGAVDITTVQAAVLGVPAHIDDAGKLVLAKLDEEGNQVEVKWHFSGSGGFRLPDSVALPSSGTYNYYLHLILSDVSTPANLKALISLRGTKTLGAQAADGNGNTYPAGTVFSVAIRGSYDASSGAQTIIYAPETNNAIPAANQAGGRYEAIARSGTAKTFTDVGINQGAAWSNLAWGDDSQGGVLSRGTFSTEERFYTEYYNDVGELIGMKMGNKLPGNNYDWLAGLDGKFINLHRNLGTANLTSAATLTSLQVKVYESWAENGSRSVTSAYLSLDGGTTWIGSGTDLWPAIFASSNADYGTMPMPWVVIYKQNDGTTAASTAWKAGDVVFFNSQKTTGTDASGNYVAYSYTRGFAYPTATTLYGGSYFVENSFPLKYLSLDSVLGAAGYRIQYKEGSPLSFNGQDGVSHSATPYNYWLQDDFLTARSSTGPFLRPDLGDIDISYFMRLVEFWQWDATASANVSTQGYIATTTETAPPGFTVLGASAITTVSAGLDVLVQAALPAVDAASLATLADSLGIAEIADADLASYP
ncbi:MAG: hypothetical protein WCL50_02330 [Spirochaetota bacterium]